MYFLRTTVLYAPSAADGEPLLGVIREHNDTTHWRQWEFYIHFRQQTHPRGSCLPHGQLASYWLAKTWLEEESPSKSSKFFYPCGIVHTVTTKEPQPAHSVLNDHWTSLADVLTRSQVILSVPIFMFRYHGAWNNITWGMPETLAYISKRRTLV